MWRVYKHTGKEKDYEVYKEALNAATNELRESKRNFGYKLANNIKPENKSLNASQSSLPFSKHRCCAQVLVEHCTEFRTSFISN